MRTSCFILLAGSLAAAGIATTASDAEARGRRGGRSFFVLPIGSGSAAAAALRKGEERAGTEVPVRKGATPAEPRRPETARKPAEPAPAAPAAAESSNVVVAAAEWCPTHRVVGTGAGFCDLNPRPLR